MKYTDKMREQAGQGDIESESHTDDHIILDMALTYQKNAHWRYQVTVDNLADKEEIVSRRPLGARPHKPRSVIASVRYEF